MAETPRASESMSVSDGVAIVAGAAVASVHLRGVMNERFIGPDWMVILVTFGWVALSSTGPFLFLLRRFLRRSHTSLKVGERLWSILGVPWLAAALLQGNRPQVGQPASELVSTVLTVGIGFVSLVSMAVIWKTWVIVSPSQADLTFSGPWANQVGLVLAIAWPIQCGVGMVVIG